MENIERILTECIGEVRSGRATVEQCLEKNSAVRAELEPLLKLALNIAQPVQPVLDASTKQAVRTRLMQQIKDEQVSESWFSRVFKPRNSSGVAWARIALSVVAFVVVLSMVGGGTAYAAQDSLPGETLYPVKIAAEDVRVTFAGDVLDKAELNMQFAGVRLEEMKILVTSSDSNAELAVEGYQENLDAALSYLSGEDDPVLLVPALERYMAELKNQVILCDEIVDIMPQLNLQTQHAAQIAVNSQSSVLQQLAEEDSLSAAELNLEMMQNRLDRAQSLADQNRYETMLEALEQYRQYNQVEEQIMLSAGDSEIAEQIRQMTSDALRLISEKLNGLAEQVPQQYRGAVANSQADTDNLQQKNSSASGDTGSGTGNGGQSDTGSGTDSGQGTDQSSDNQGGSSGDTGSDGQQSGGSQSTDTGSDSGNNTGSDSQNNSSGSGTSGREGSSGTGK